MRKKFPLYGSWLLSLTLIFGMSTPISAQAESKTTAQVEAVQAKRQAVNSNIGISDRSSNRPMAFPDPYCEIADATDVIVEEITVVEFAGTEITNDDDDNVLIDKTDVVVEITAGDTYTISVEGNTNGDFETNIVAFIDWNQNGILDDAGEIYELGTLENSTGYDGVSVSMDITVPADAVPGQTRVRITKTYFDEFSDPIINPCGIEFDPWGMGIYPGYGQALDFTLNIEEDSGGGMAYCIPEGTNSGRYINNFSTTSGSENISNMGSGFSPDGYGDFYDTHTVAQAQGEDVEFEVDIVGGTAGFRVWVDWNQDGVFDTTEEVAYASSGYSANHTGSFTVPADALVGDTRMRIVSHWLSTTGDVDPCETGFTYGEFEDYKFTVEEGSGGGGGTACEQVFYDAVQPTGVGFSSGNAVANDITVAAGESFTMETMTFDVVNIAGLPSEFDLEIFDDNGSGGVGTTTGMTYHFDSSNMTFVENGTFSIYTQYTVTLTLPNIELTADASEDARYWLAIAADLTTTGDFTYWVSYDYVTNPDSYPSWQYNDTDGWFEYVDANSLTKEGIMTVSGMCEGGTGGGGTAGETCEDAITVTDLPYTDAGNTADYGNFYSNGDVPPVATGAVTNGTGSPFYLTGDEVVYAYTPADDEVLNISTTNADDWVGLWAFTGCPFTSTVGYHTGTSGATRLIPELPVTAGETYYFVLSTWPAPQSTEYTILIERVGGTPPGGDCSLATEGVFENGKSFTKNLDRVVANDIVVPAGQNMLLEKINLNALIGGVGSGVTAADVDVYVYEDNSGMPGALVTMIPDVVPTSQTIIGDAFGFQAYDVEIDFAAVNLPGQESAETTYWIGASLDATDGSNVFWEFYSNATAPVVGYGLAYDDGAAGFIIESQNEGVYTFHATCSDIGGGGSDCISTLYSGGNNGSPGGAVYFDITVGPEDIELTSIDLNTDLVGTGFSVDVYTIDGTYVGNETNQGAWTMRTSGSGTSAGEGSPSTATLDDTFVLSANTTYGMALVLDSTHSHHYTNGDGTNEHFENADIALDLGAATNTPFDGTVFTPRVFNGGLCYNVGGGGTGDDCDQGDDSNGFENGYNITAGGTFRNADDFIVSAGNTLNVRSIVLNVFANEPVSSVNINFFEDDGGMPGSTIVESVSGLVPYAQVPIGSNFGYTIYGVYLEVDLNFAGGASGASYWMQPEAVSPVAFWEVTSVGSLGEVIHTSESMGPWMPDEDGVNHAVFKLHCEVVTAPDPGCLFDITASVEPITRVVLAGIDNTSSAVVNGSPALEDFTHIEGTMRQGTEYDIALEGNTDGNWTNYFTVWIDWDQNGVWEADEMYEIGSIQNSTGTDGQQATGTITVPADAPLGSTTMRVIKSFGSSPTDPCGQYSFGQGEDYTIIVEERVGIDDQSMTTFTYYPNPTSGIVNITANKDISSVSVVNILGQQVIATKSLDNGQVDLSALATGTYMFRVTFEDGSLETFKVLKE